jgi:hypothetical protein
MFKCIGCKIELTDKEVFVYNDAYLCEFCFELFKQMSMSNQLEVVEVEDKKEKEKNRRVARREKQSRFFD